MLSCPKNIENIHSDYPCTLVIREKNMSVFRKVRLTQSCVLKLILITTRQMHVHVNCKFSIKLHFTHPKYIFFNVDTVYESKII